MKSDPKARVMALVRAARRLADPRDLAGSSVRASLVEQGPLSAQGVDLVLRDHLEIHPTDADLDALVGWAERAPRVHVVLSAHVFAGALRALALAVAAAPSVEVRMSRRESVFATALVDAVDDSEVTNTIRFVDRLRPRPCDEVHLYGRDATMREIARTLPPEVRVWAHGTGLGLAVVGASADLPEAAWQVVSDVVPFDQRGCLSPRVVVVEGSVERALCLARGLAEAMNRMRQRVPVGRLYSEELAERTRYQDTCLMTGDLFEVGEGSVGCGSGFLVPPPGRNVHVMAADAGEGLAWLRPWDPSVAAVGTAGGVDDPLVAATLDALPRARRSPLGRMQKPALDGPVDLRASARVVAGALD